MSGGLNNIDFSFDCNEDSSAFAACGGNEYCSSCSSVVYDLTEKSYSEIQVLLELHGGEVCGRFYLDQVDTTSGYQRPIGLNMVAAGLATLLTLAASENARAQMPPVPVEQHVNSGNAEKTKPTVRNLESTSEETEQHRTIKEKPEKEEKELVRKKLFKIGRMRVFSQNKFPYIKVRLRSARRGKVLYVRGR